MKFLMAALALLLLTFTTIQATGDSKMLEARMAEALKALDGLRKSADSAPLNGSEQRGMNATSNISSFLPSGLNLSAGASAGINGGNLTGNSSVGIGSGSNVSFNGYYGITASRHEIGKSDITSRIFLNGSFEVDKSVQFHDRGI